MLYQILNWDIFLNYANIVLFYKVIT